MLVGMSNLTRSQRESRAYALILTTGGLGVASVVVFVLAVLGAASFGLFVLLIVATAIALYAARRTLKL
jgi:type IV secretory pathway TrbD component